MRIVLLAFSLWTLVLSSCVDTQVNNPPKELSAEEQKKLDEYKLEVEVGRNMAGRLLSFYGINGDAALQDYVSQIGQYVAGYSDFPERRYMFAILDTEMVNAFACPGGYILLTLGLLREVRSEAELAMILGHEITHVGKQHMFKVIQNMNEKELAQKASKSDIETDEDKFRKRPSAESSAAANQIARYLSGSTGAGLSILQAAKAGMDLILEEGIDKKLEFEADWEGVRFAIAAGYDPISFVTFLSRLESEKKKAGVDTKMIDKTHPPILARKEQVNKLLMELNAKDIIGADGEERFMKIAALIPALKKK